MKKKLRALSRKEIVSMLEKHRDVLSKYKIKKIGLFGSFAKGEESLKSDIDLFVDFEEPSFDNFMGLSNFLEELFGRRVEILTPAGIESIRIKHIKKEIQKSITYV